MTTNTSKISSVKKILLVLAIFMYGGVAAQNWQQDFKIATELAAKKERPVLLVFSGSDWCAPCMKLDRKIWQSAAFKEYAIDHLVLLKVDFPRKKANKLSEEQELHNKNLAEKYNPNGYFPLVLLTDKSGKQIAFMQPLRRETPANFVERLKKAIH